MKIIDKITFTSPINIDNGYVNIPQGEHESTMELLEYNIGDCIDPFIKIEWDNPVDIVHMNIEYHISNDNLKVVTGYDGVFELPEQVIELLERNGFDCKEVI